ncbi:MAG: 4Fe-4S binding protein [Syntrophales bacterium]|nr:4Fe-4S binding protein [Syntrophales bacterium]MDD5531763.1 4Fe-4S binding protein [Syntrophales bacterium]
MVYERLRKHLDSLPTGFPKTESGVELKILKRIFSEEEAEMACQVSLFPETAAGMAARLKKDPEATAGLLYRMSRKGQILRFKVNGEYHYMSAMFIVGIFEYQVNNLDPGLVELFKQYANEAMYRQMILPETPQLRVVPVEESLTPALEIAPYDEIRKIVESQKVIALADCICRKMNGMKGKPCHAALETCLIFGAVGEFYIENGMGRKISVEDALGILRKNEDAGLVPSPFNTQRAGGGVCSCCSCCCEMLKAIKLDARPGRVVKSNYCASVQKDLCTGCEICLDRCQMEAISIVDESAAVNLDRCVGCGLCVTTCPVEALQLRMKSPGELYVPPMRPVETYMRIGMELAKLKE